MLFRAVTPPHRKPASDLYRFAAPIYDLATAMWSGGAIWRSRLACLCGVKEGDRVLIPGPGTGRLAVEAARRGAAVTAVELSSVMGRRLESRALRALGSSRFHASYPKGPADTPNSAPGTLVLVRGEVDALPVRPEFDLVVAEHFLNVFQPKEMAPMRSRLIERVVAGGRLAIADFSPIPRSAAAPLRALQRGHHVIPLGGCSLLTRNAFHAIYDHGADLSGCEDLRLALDRDFRSFALGPGWFHTWIFEKMARDD